MTPPKSAKDIPAHIKLAREMAANHHLIEDDEIYCDEDGRQLFDGAVTRCRELCARTTDAVLEGLPPFRTTNHRFSRGAQPKIEWPWA